MPPASVRSLPLIAAAGRLDRGLSKLVGINEEMRITTYNGIVRTDEIHHKWELVGTLIGCGTFFVNALSQGIPPDIVMNGQSTAIILP